MGITEYLAITVEQYKQTIADLKRENANLVLENESLNRINILLEKKVKHHAHQYKMLLQNKKFKSPKH